MEESVDKVKLYEFESDDHDSIVLTGIVSQIFNRIKDTGFDKEYRLDSLLNTLADRGLDIDREEFIEMIQNPPLKNLISNVKGDMVVFKGQDNDDDMESLAMEPDETTDTLKKMARRASKK